MMSRELTSVLFPSFVNYTDEMYLGNEPCGKVRDHLNGGYRNRWSCKWGDGESYKGELINANFSINEKIRIYIIGSVLWIVDHRHAGKNDVWEYSSDPEKIRMHNKHPKLIHELEPDKIEKILNTKIDCKFWEMVQSRAKEIYEVGR